MTELPNHPVVVSIEGQSRVTGSLPVQGSYDQQGRRELKFGSRLDDPAAVVEVNGIIYVVSFGLTERDDTWRYRNFRGHRVIGGWPRPGERVSWSVESNASESARNKLVGWALSQADRIADAHRTLFIDSFRQTIPDADNIVKQAAKRVAHAARQMDVAAIESAVARQLTLVDNLDIQPLHAPVRAHWDSANSDRTINGTLHAEVVADGQPLAYMATWSDRGYGIVPTANIINDPPGSLPRR